MAPMVQSPEKNMELTTNPELTVGLAIRNEFEVISTSQIPDEMYRKGLEDYVAGRRDTLAALAYVAYWSQPA